MTKQKYWVVGNTHVDLAWKKDRREMEEVLDIYLVRLLDMLDSHPTFTYTIEQAAHYRLLKKRRPDLFARIKHYVDKGRLEMVGGMASSLETNLPNGESFVRNQLIGLRWVKEHLGVDVQTPWLIDTFGINAQIPQILNQFGFKRLMANRFGGNIHEDVFLSKGIDGTELLILGMDVYSPYVKHGHLYWKFVNNWAEIDNLFKKAAAAKDEGPILITAYTENEVLPCLRPDYHIEQGNANGKEGVWQYGTLSHFFDALEATGKPWPVVHGDLNPEFTGTYSQRIAIRLRNRQIETFMLEAEKWAALTQLNSDWQVQLEEAWWEIAYIQFHDVFTGSHPTSVYESLMKSVDEVESTAKSVLHQALTQQHPQGSPSDGMSRVQAFNGLPWDRYDIVSIPLTDELSGVNQVFMDDKKIPFDLKDGQLRIMAALPATGSQLFTIEPGNIRTSSEKMVESAVIENEFMKLECDTTGLIKRLIWKETGAVIMEDATDLLSVQRDNGSFQIESFVGEEIPAITGNIEVVQCESTAIGERLIVKGEFPELASIGQAGFLTWEAEFELRAGKPALYLQFRIRWQGEGSRLRFNLSTKINNSDGIYEIPFGTVRRKPYRERGTAKGEWPSHRFAAIEDSSHGVALINTGAGGVEVSNGRLSSTILRAPQVEYAGMIIDETSSQHGDHTFQFVIAPYAGHWYDAKVIQLAQEANVNNWGMVYSNKSLRASTVQSWMRLSEGTVVLSAVKSPEGDKGELIVRLYETAGISTVAELWVHGAKQAWKSNLKEDYSDDLLSCVNETILIKAEPYEIITIRIAR